MKGKRILAIGPFEPLSESNKLNELLLVELECILRRSKECLVIIFDLRSLQKKFTQITFDQVYKHMHACYSASQSFCTLNDKLLLDVSVLYFPFCLQPLSIPHDELVILREYNINLLHQESNFQCEDLSQQQFNKFSRVALGGTFDHLHSGHKILLATSSMLCHQRIFIGISDANLLENKPFQGQLETFERRKERVEAFVHLFKGQCKVECMAFRLLDAFGPTISDSSIECIVVSIETVSGALEINARREALGMPELEIKVIDMLVRNEEALPQDEIADKISSTLIREYLFKQAK
jgi:phosphopantetheine adenylyltransferase